MIKKILSFALIIGIMLSITITVNASEIDNKANNVITIGYIAGYGGIDDIDSIFQKGYLYDVFVRLSSYCNYTFEFKEYSDYYELIEALKNNEIQYMGPITELVAEKWDLSKSMELTESVIFLAKENDGAQLHYDDFEKIDGKTIASYHDSSIETYLNEYCDEKGISVNYIRSDIYNYNELEADYYLTTSTDFKFDDYLSAINLKTLPLCTVTTNENANTEFNKTLIKAFDNMISSDVDFLHTMHAKYYGGTVNQRRTLTRKEVEMIQNSTFKVAFESGHDFFSYINKDGKPDGLLINLINSITTRYGITIEYLPYRMDGSGENSLEYVVENADVILSSLGRYKDFISDFSLTDTYMDIPYTVLVDEELYYSDNDKTKARIGILHNLFIPQDETDGLPYDVSIIAYDSISQIYSDFNNNKIDGFFVSECAIPMVREHIRGSYFVLPTDASTPYKMWISNELGKDYINIFNVIFEQISPQIFEKLMLEEQAKYKAPPKIEDIMVANLPLLISIIVFIIFFLVVIYLSLVMKNEKKLKNIVEVDSITGLMTITKMMSEVTKLLENSKPNEYYILSCDIDNFKTINQTYNIEKGNELLCAVANSMRKYASKDVLMCRLQNDIFVVFGKRSNVDNFSTTTLLFSQERCDEIIQSIGISSILHFSTGVYVIENKHVSIEKAIDNVRKARYISKTKHGNVVTIYSEELKLKTEKENEIYANMEKAIKNKEFFIVIQPKIELETGKLVGGEVLVRWKNEYGKLIYPEDYIPLFEGNSFIVNLDIYVFEETCRFVKSATVPLPHLSINISIMTALSENFVENYMEILDRYNLKPKQFELELTESALDYNYEKIYKVTMKLKRLGFILSLDDFGKGASSLARINSLDVDIVKLDRGFIANNINKEKGNSVVNSTIALVINLGIRTLAEGIETKEQLDMLVEFGCDLGQGYLFDMPLSTSEFTNRVIEDSKKIYPKAVKSKGKIRGYLSNFENLPYGIAITKNDSYSTIIKANQRFYDIIGHTKEGLYDKYENRLTDIMVDNPYYKVEKKDTTNDYDIELDLHIKTANGDDIWVTDYAHYDALEDIFFVTFIDSTDKMIINSEKLSFTAYQAQKESLLYMNDLTSDYTIVSDIENDEIVFVNENAMKLFGFSCEEDWIGRNYHSIYGGNIPMYHEYNNAVLEKGYGSREYYNEYLRLYLHIESKIIMVMDRKMRLNIVSDITSRKKIENENNLQNTLKECIEYLYTTATTNTVTTNSDITTTAIQNMLKQLKLYYYSDRVYYYAFDEDGETISHGYEVLRDGIQSAKEAVLNLPLENRTWLINELKTQNSVYQHALSNISEEEQDILNQTYEDNSVNSFIYAAVKDFDGNIIGFLGVDNPRENSDNPELMNLLSKYIWMFIKSMNMKKLEKEAVKSEELSVVNALEKGAILLQGFEKPNENITEVLGLLRKHYGASQVTLISIDKENLTYSMTHESCDSSTKARISEIQNIPITLFDELMEPFKNGVQFTTVNVEDIPYNSHQRKKWDKFGITSVIIAPLFDKNGEVTAFISVNNRTLINRNQTLASIMAKDINDYLEKLSLEERYREEVMLDPLTNLFNKIATQDSITANLGEGVTGILFIIDIDYFKNLNDTLGHIVGDVALVEIAAEIKKTFRNSDVVGRIGGDEFMVFCPDPITEEIAITKANSICKNCNKVYEKDGLLVEITTSIGIHRIDEKDYTFKEVYERVDKGLYVAKKRGKNQFYITE